MLESIKKAQEMFKTQAEFAKSVGLTQATVSYWLNEKKTPNANSAIKIEKATGGAVKRHEILPEIFGDAA